MSPLLLKAVISITLALVFYTIGVWSERRAKLLKSWHLAFFWMGLVMDVTGTKMMSLINDQTQNAMSLHGITGLIAIILMMFHAIWATVVIVRNSERALSTFHRFSVIVWIIWLIPYIIGMFMGMSR